MDRSRYSNKAASMMADQLAPVTGAGYPTSGSLAARLHSPYSVFRLIDVDVSTNLWIK